MPVNAEETNNSAVETLLDMLRNYIDIEPENTPFLVKDSIKIIF
jgi:5'-3' exonuclease